MSDFHQHGLIATLHRFGSSQVSLEEELLSYAKERPIVLVLPCHGSEMGSEAVERIIAGVKTVKYLSEIVVSMNGVAEEDREAVRTEWQEAGELVTVVFNDDWDRIDMLVALSGLKADALVQGKGLNLWSALQVLSVRYEDATVVAHDCDILTYRPELLSRLAYCCANPEFSMSFAKGYYSRVRERFYGRVTRLFMSPMMRSLIRVAGHQPLLDFLDGFRYPLAGEFAAPLEVIAAMPISPGWRLEIGMLCEVFRRIDPAQVCQVDLAIDYEHKHQSLRSTDGEGGLERMCREISLELLAQVRKEGVFIDNDIIRTLSRTYYRTALETLRRYALDAKINGLSFDRDREVEAIEVFSDAFDTAVTSSAAPAVLRPWRK